MTFYSDQFESYDHELRGRPGRCERCGKPLLLGFARCLHCVVFGGPRSQLPSTAPAPPLQGYLEQAEPSDEELAQLRQILNANDLRHAVQRAAYEERQAWVKLWRQVWTIDLPANEDLAGFPLDRACQVCCDIKNETFHELVYRPTAPGYRCPVHSREEVAK